VVHTIHGWSSICGDQGRAVRAGVVGIERRLARRTARLVVVTEVDRTIGLAAGIGRDDQYALVRSPLDASEAAAARRSRDESRGALGLGSDDFVVGSVARLAAPKDPFTLLRAFGRLSAARPETMLVLIGGGPLEDALRVEATAAGVADRVRFVGSHPRAAQLVGAFDVAVLASRWEGLPRTIVEAAAARIPIVANCVGGVGDIVEDGISGSCFAVGDDQALAAALGRVMDDPSGTARMIDVAERRVQGEFGIDAVTDQLSGLWRLAAAAPVRTPEPIHAS
jgi:glycosyltransferase involved in cell wall biosynthesis